MRKIIFFISLLASIISFAQDGSLDTSFNAPEGIRPDMFLKYQPDGKIIIVERFIEFGDEYTSCLIRRLNTDGSVDYTFAHGIGVSVYTYVRAVAIQSDGKILIFGSFYKVNDDFVQNLARLNPDGSLDSSFSREGQSNILAIAIQPDGKLILGGHFPKGIIRLSASGTLDPSFNSPIDFIPEQTIVTKIVLMPDNKILAGGHVRIQGQVKRVFLLNSIGGLDMSFALPSNLDFPPLSTPRFLMREKTGTILLACSGLRIFADLDTTIGYDFIRLAPNGSLIHVFHPFPRSSDRDSEIFPAALQNDGKIIMTGYYSSNYYGNEFDRIARLNYDGSFDETFHSGFEGDTGFNIGSFIYSNVEVQSDDKILIGGEFTEYDGIPVSNIIRLNVGRLSNPEYNNTTMKVYPNPVSDNLHIQFPSDINDIDRTNLEIYDMTMKKIDFNWSNNDFIDVSDFSSGVYLLKIKTENSTFTSRFVKN